MSSAYACGICANELRSNGECHQARFCEWRGLNVGFHLEKEEHHDNFTGL